MICFDRRKCDICHYWSFLDKRFKFQLEVCNGYHDAYLRRSLLMVLSMYIMFTKLLKKRFFDPSY